MKIAVLPGDGIGKEVTSEAVKVLRAVLGPNTALELVEAPIGQAGIEAAGDPLPAETAKIAGTADAILFGAAGMPGDRKSVVSGTSVSVRVDPGGCRIINKKKQNKQK